MKKSSAASKIIIFIFIIVGYIGCDHNNHIGTWEGKSDSDEAIKLIFKPNSELEIYLSRRGEEKSSYQFDYSRDPIWLDIDLRSLHGGRTKLSCIAKFIAEDEIDIGLPIFESGERPLNLSPESVGELWILKRAN